MGCSVQLLSAHYQTVMVAAGKVQLVHTGSQTCLIHQHSSQRVVIILVRAVLTNYQVQKPFVHSPTLASEHARRNSFGRSATLGTVPRRPLQQSALSAPFPSVGPVGQGPVDHRVVQVVRATTCTMWPRLAQIRPHRRLPKFRQVWFTLANSGQHSVNFRFNLGQHRPQSGQSKSTFFLLGPSLTNLVNVGQHLAKTRLVVAKSGQTRSTSAASASIGRIGPEFGRVRPLRSNFGENGAKLGQSWPAGKL